MKKETLYEIYDCALDVRLITDNLYNLEMLNTKEGNIFLSFVKNGLVDKETFEYLRKLTTDISSCDMDANMEENLVYLITETLMNDYDNNDLDFCNIIENYSLLLDTEVVMDFKFYNEEEGNYYKMFIIKEFSRMLIAISNVDKVHSHDICIIMDAYKSMLDDLKSTTSLSNVSYNEKLKNRIRIFVDLITNNAIYDLCDEKFKAILNIASKTSSLEKLKLLYASKFKKNLNYKDFIEEVDSFSPNFNRVTIDRIYNIINIRKEKDADGSILYRRSIKKTEAERDIIKKVLKPENNA